LVGTSGTLVGGDPGVPLSLNEQVPKVGAARDLPGVVFWWALYCHDSVVWLALAIRPRVVVVVTASLTLFLLLLLLALELFLPLL
jgi:hypothetical protein